MQDGSQNSQEASSAVPELPVRVLETYARLWQLEIWLRRMVYTELRAALGSSWHTKLQVGTAEKSRDSDRRLTHMPSPEMSLLSYMTFGNLCQTVTQEWHLFQCYLPPKDLWEAKLDEIRQVRHRIAHFRIGHEDDLQRVIQVLRDVDRGFWQFCTSYNAPTPVLPPSDDPVVERFLSLDQFPYSEVEKGCWARIGTADPTAIFGMTVEVLNRPWRDQSKVSQTVGSPGCVYDVTITSRDGRIFDSSQYLQDTEPLHAHLAHILLVDWGTIRMTIPAVLGIDTIVQLIERLVRWIPNAVRRSSTPVPDPETLEARREKIQALAGSWPEYVLGPKNPLVYLEPGMSCSFFNV